MTAPAAVLRACVPPEPDLDRIREAAAAVENWDDAVALAAQHGVTGLVARRLDRAGAEPPPAIRDELDRAERVAARRGLALAVESARIGARLEAAGLGALALKGPALSALAYGDVAIRHSGDLDLLVRPEEGAAAQSVLAADGYRPEEVWPPARRRLHERAQGQLVPLRRGGVVLEIHTAVHPPWFGVDHERSGIWRRWIRVATEGGPIAAPSAEDTLLVVAAHAARSRWARLEWAVSIAWLAHRCPLDWELVTTLAARMGARRILALGLQLAADAAGPLPAEARAAGDEAGAARLAPALAPLAQRPSPAAPEIRLDEHDPRLRRAHLRLHERRVDRLRYAVGILRPTAEEARRVSLPPSLDMLYWPLRWVRLMRALGRSLTR